MRYISIFFHISLALELILLLSFVICKEYYHDSIGRRPLDNDCGPPTLQFY